MLLLLQIAALSAQLSSAEQMKGTVGEVKEEVDKMMIEVKVRVLGFRGRRVLGRRV